MMSFLPRWAKSPSYNHLQDDEINEKGQEDGQIIRQRRSRWTQNTFLWISTILFASLSVYLSLTREKISPFGTFERGYKTELAAARAIIKTEHRWFTGAPTWTKTGEAHLMVDPKAPKYVGNASDELDDNWDDFIGGRYFHLSEAEAREAWGPQYTEFWDHQEGAYVAGLDVMHLLHCLNMIRQEFDADRYPPPKHVNPLLHRNHCIENLRQAIMCNADLAPIPTRWYDYLDQNYIDSNRPHVCRNWGAIRDFVTERKKKSIVAPKPQPHHKDNLTSR